MLSTVPYSVVNFMGWTPGTAPNYAQDVDYTSNATSWSNLKVVNYEPAHYPSFSSSGILTLNNGTTPLPDGSFQANIANDFPQGGQDYGTYVNYLTGNPMITIYNDLQQLQAAGFNGVRLYGSESAVVYVATIEAAYKLSHVQGGQPFYVYYEVGVTPRLFDPMFYGGSIAQRQTTLYNILTNDDRPATQPTATLQELHYVINVVGPQVFAATVPVVFFSHEDLVQEQGNNGPFNDDNSSTQLLRWGINATRALLKNELGGQPLPTVTTAILAGQIVQVNKAYHDEVMKLLSTIEHDPNAPLCYDIYPFQYGDRYYDQVHPYPNTDPNNIPNAFPNGAMYYDNTSWSSGPPPAATWSVQDTVSKADLMWSLQ